MTGGGLPGIGVLLAAALCAGFGAAVVLVVAGIRGTAIRGSAIPGSAIPGSATGETVPEPGRFPGRVGELASLLRSPALTSRVAAAVVAGGLVLVLTRWPVAAAGVCALVMFWPQLFGGSRAERRQIDHLEALVLWTEALRDTVAAHASLEQAIPATAAHAPPLIRPALIRLVGQMRSRLPLDKALLDLAAMLDDPGSADPIIAALILSSRRRGSGLGQALTGLADSARAELDRRRWVSQSRAPLRRGVQIVVALTLVFAGGLVVFSPDFVAPYATAGGQVALTVVAAIFTTGFVWMRQLAGTEKVPPFLTRPGHRLSGSDLQVVARLAGRARRSPEIAGRGARR